MTGNILIVEDEQAIRDMLVFALGRAGYQCDVCESAEEARNKLIENAPNLLLLDCMLPGQSGVDFLRWMRADPYFGDLPVIMLTALGEETDKIRGLDTGADDYITKPFSTKELLARIRSLIRRTTPHLADVSLELNGLVLDPVSFRVSAEGNTIKIGPTEFKLLQFFMSHPERVYSRAQLLDMVWGPNVYIEERTVDVHIRRLREALSPYEYDQNIQTVRGAGYRFSRHV